MRKYKIGITFNLEAKVTDIWANGANQNVIHLYHLFQHSDIVEDVVLVSWGPEKRTTPPEGFMLDGLNLKYAYIDDVIDQLDVLIEGTLVIEPHQVTRMHQHGGKLFAIKWVMTLLWIWKISFLIRKQEECLMVRYLILYG